MDSFDIFESPDIILAVLGDELQPTTSRFVCVRCGLRTELSLDQNGLV